MPTTSFRVLEAGRPVGGRYTLVAPLGEGGLGSVWQADDAMLGRSVAIKVPRPDVQLLPIHLTRIEREARVAAAIDHENVVRVLDYGVDLAFGPFIVMELLRGRTLDDELAERETLRLREILAWLEPVGRALDAIHAAGLAHRDVKPTNIMLAERDGRSAVKILDFGIASYLDGHDRLTQQGLIVGTPEYMAPEVAEGRAASRASDVYSLAVIAFEALTGRLPHDGETPMSQLAAKTTARAASLSDTTGRMFALRLEDAFAEALETDPEQRIGVASDFIASLQACLR